MKNIKISVVIPYARRIENIKYCLQSLNDQSLHKNEYEVLIGCLEYSIELLEFIKNNLPELQVVLVISNEKWNVSRSRNIAISRARGKVIAFVDADMIIPYRYLELHYTTHNNSDKELLIIGQTRYYDEGIDINACQHLPYEFYKNNFLSKNANEIDLPKDVRWTISIYIDWAMGWTFNLSITRKHLEAHNLYFDENFKGWGVEDIEWSYRSKIGGARVYFSNDIWAIHLPHLRDISINNETEKINFKKMLCKWPVLEVEIVTSIGDIKGNMAYPTIAKSISTITKSQYPDVCTIEFESSNGEKKLFVGGSANTNSNQIDHSKLPDDLKKFKINKIYNLLGLSLPYTDNSVHSVYLAPQINQLDGSIKEMIHQEVKRISNIIK